MGEWRGVIDRRLAMWRRKVRDGEDMVMACIFGVWWNLDGTDGRLIPSYMPLVAIVHDYYMT